MTKVFSIFMLLMFSIPSYAHNYIDNWINLKNPTPLSSLQMIGHTDVYSVL